MEDNCMGAAGGRGQGQDTGWQLPPPAIGPPMDRGYATHRQDRSGVVDMKYGPIFVDVRWKNEHQSSRKIAIEASSYAKADKLMTVS